MGGCHPSLGVRRFDVDTNLSFFVDRDEFRGLDGCLMDDV